MADRPAVVAREMTKQFEELRRGTVASFARTIEERPAARGGRARHWRARSSQRGRVKRTCAARVRALRAAGLSVARRVGSGCGGDGCFRSVWRIVSRRSDGWRNRGMTVRPVALGIAPLALAALASAWRVERVRLPPVLTDRASPVRRRRRLVREPVEPPQPPGRDSAADVASSRQDRSARHADGRQALGLSLHPRHGARQHQVQRRRGRAAARVSASAAAFCTSTTIMGSMKAFGERSSACFRTGRSSTCR